MCCVLHCCPHYVIPWRIWELLISVFCVLSYDYEHVPFRNIWSREEAVLVHFHCSRMAQAGQCAKKHALFRSQTWGLKAWGWVASFDWSVVKACSRCHHGWCTCRRKARYDSRAKRDSALGFSFSLITVYCELHGEPGEGGPCPMSHRLSTATPETSLKHKSPGGTQTITNPKQRRGFSAR